MIKLPESDGTLTVYHPTQAPRVVQPADPSPFRTRSVLATAHVLGDPLADNEPFGPPGGSPPPQSLDWEATLAFRRHLWSYGFTLCEGMDTAHRGMGLDWPRAAELIRRCGAEARAVGGRMAAAVLTDQLEPFAPVTLAEVQAAYEEQLAVVEEAGAQPVIMCSPHLNVAVRGPEDFATVYGNLLRQSSQPAILHWITSEWDPRNSEYFGYEEPDDAYDALIAIVRDNLDKVDGVKIGPASLARQVEWRKRLPEGVKFYTSDTTEYPEMFVGDGSGHSHALTPVIDAVVPIAAEAFRALDAGDDSRARELLDETLPLNRHLFSGEGRSIFFFKTGVVFLGWLAGHHDHFRMVWGEQSARSMPHLAAAYRLADTLGALPDPELAERRMKLFLATSGIEQ
ncbi:DUF993 family protein [Micromonospora sp. NPDC050200]|uniref:DUF993 family protein n=1 Tax=Micromonospora sp. NPDC050200 TaxID=3155664 RepID=UPI0033FFED28